jgi:hypothetical protein
LWSYLAPKFVKKSFWAALQIFQVPNGQMGSVCLLCSVARIQMNCNA